MPVANPIGLAQQTQGYLRGRYEANSAGNFNRGYADLAAPVGEAVAGRLGADAAANVAAIRAAMAAALAGAEPRDEIGCCGTRCCASRYDADFVLDLHADNEAVLHLYIGTPLWPDAADFAAELGARAVLLAEVSGGNPFDEACSGPWWALARRFPEAAIPPACLAATVELRSNNDVDAGLAEDDAAGAPAVPDAARGRRRRPRRALPAAAVRGDAARRHAAGDRPGGRARGLPRPARRAGGGGRAGGRDRRSARRRRCAVAARTAGVLFARHDQPFAWPGKVIGKIAGARRCRSGRDGF